MSPEQHQRITTLFHEALALPESERGSLLAQEPTLRAEVEALLAAEAQLGDFIEMPALSLTAELLAEDRARLTQGEMLAHYRIKSLLGAGGMGEVWLAEDTRLGRQVALKLLPPHFTQDAARLARFEQEARTASSLNHPNLMMIFELGESELGRFIAMERIEGRTLRHLLHKRRPALSETLEMIMQIASGLAAAHQAGVVHGDIKPENIMLRDDGFVKVLDFGLARLVTDASAQAQQDTGEIAIERPAAKQASATSVHGTARYVSPEQARGESIDGRSDLFSLGVMFYEMLAGRAPFQGNNTADIIAAILQKEPPSLQQQVPELPTRLVQIVERLLRKEPADRYQSANALLNDLRTVKRELDFKAELASQKSGASPIASKPLWSRRSTIAIAAACSVAALIIGGWALHRWRTRANAGLTLTNSDTVLLADFDNQTGNPLFDGSLQQALTSQLAQSPFINLLADVHKRDTLKLMGLKGSDPVNAAVARDICLRRHLKAFLRGSLKSQGTTLRVTLEAIKPATGAVLVRQEADADDATRVLSALGAATTKFRAQLGESLTSLQRFDAPIEQVTTPSLMALKAYVQARDLARVGKAKEAETLYQYALTLDPNFATVHAALATLNYNEDHGELARKYAQSAFALKDRVSESERYRITELYYTIATEELDKAIEILKLSRETFPREIRSYISLGNIYFKIGRYELAEQVQREAYELDKGYFQVFTNLGVTLLRLNRFDEAQKIYEEALARGLENIDIREDLYVLEEIKDNDEGMQRRVAEAQNHPRGSTVLNWQARTAIIRGQFKRAVEFEKQELAVAQKDNDQDLIMTVEASRTRRRATYGQCREVPASAERLLRQQRNQTNVSDAAFWFALCGDTRRAESLLAVEEKFSPSLWHEKFVNRPVTRAVIALRRNAPAQAIAELEALKPVERKSKFWGQYVRALAYLQLKQPANAINELQTALAHRGWSPSTLLWPLLHLELARAYRAQGDNAASRQTYETLFSIWKNADQDLAQLAEAKKEYASLPR